MRQVPYSAYELAQRYVGVQEVPGEVSNPLILAMLKLDADWPQDDEVPWCSAFVNWVCWNFRLPRSKSLRARSWLKVGVPIPDLREAEPGFDIVVLARGGGNQPGPDVIDAPGHVGFFAGVERGTAPTRLLLLGGNQGNEVSLASYSVDRILGARRLA